MSPPVRAPRSAADVLADAALASVRGGKLALAHAQLSECLAALRRDSSRRRAAAALEATAELALAIGELEPAVEFHGAQERLLRESRAPVDPGASERRSATLERLRAAIGEERFAAAWSTSRTTRFPREFYVSRSRDWLRGLAPSDLRASVGNGGSASDPSLSGDGDPGTTALLVRRARDGDSAAVEQLATRYMEPLRRFGHGRLPAKARDLMDTDDLVQVTVVRALDRLDQFHAGARGRFFAYLRAILANKVRDEIRRLARRPRGEALSESTPSPHPAPLEELIEAEALDAYRTARDGLPAKQRRALALRIECGFTYEEVARAVGCPSANAARMLVSRALTRMGQLLRASGHAAGDGRR